MQSDPKDFLAEFAEAMKWPTFLSDGKCVGADPTLFDDEDAQKTIVAKQICAGCPVKKQCAQWGIENEDSGIWGGLDDKDRRKARRGKGKFTTLEKRREDLNWLLDMLGDKPVAELAAKYGKTERTIYRWRNRERKRVERLGYSPFRIR